MEKANLRLQQAVHKQNEPKKVTVKLSEAELEEFQTFRRQRNRVDEEENFELEIAEEGEEEAEEEEHEE